MKTIKNIFFALAVQSLFTLPSLLAQIDTLGIPDTPDTLRSSLIPLNWAEKEVVGISEILGGEAYCRKSATEELFKKKAATAGILHIATHAVINDANPMFSRLIFAPDSSSLEDGYLNTYELYNMKLNADMIVLSACNTGYGKLIRGEGIMSLARGCMYAGCSSIVMSLWSVDDQSTSVIMKNFYGSLVQGKSKDEALREAKLEFLKNADEIKANPFYWSGMIVIGNTEPISLKK